MSRLKIILLFVMWPGLFTTSAAQGSGLKIDLFSCVTIYDVSDPEFFWGSGITPPVITLPAKLRSIDGVKSDEFFVDYLSKNTPAEKSLALALSGGELSLEYNQKLNCIIAHVVYRSSKQLTSGEIEILKNDTLGQLSDGIGEVFQQSYAEETQYWPAFEDLNKTDLKIKITKR